MLGTAEEYSTTSKQCNQNNKFPNCLCFGQVGVSDTSPAVAMQRSQEGSRLTCTSPDGSVGLAVGALHQSEEGPIILLLFRGPQL